VKRRDIRLREYRPSPPEPRVELERLTQRARESIQDRTTLGIRLFEACEHEPGNHVIRQQVPLGHHVLSRAVLRAQQVAA
jgi:hypothetical protein